MIPQSKDELERFTPAALANLPAPPVFVFRPCSGRDSRAFQRLAIIEGLTLHDMADVRREQVVALRSLFSPEEAETAVAQFEDAWNRADQGIDVTDEETAAINGLMENLTRHHRPLRVMVADNRQFYQDSPRLALGLFLAGWTGLDLPYRREDGMVPLEYVDRLEAELTRIETEAVAANIADVVPGVAYLQLVTKALDLLNMTKAESGKSPSLSPSPVDPNGSTTTPSQTAEAGSSTAANTPKIRRGKSAKPTAT